MLSTEYYTAKHNIQGRSSRVAPAHPLDSPALPPTAILYCYEKALSMNYYVEDSTYVTCAGEFFSTSYDLDHQWSKASLASDRLWASPTRKIAMKCSEQALYVIFFLGQTQKIHHKWFSWADTFWAHIDRFIFFLHPIIDPHFEIVFRPRAWARAASTKTVVKCGSIRGCRKKIK